MKNFHISFTELHKTYIFILYSDKCQEYFNYKLYKKNINIDNYISKHEIYLHNYFNSFKLIETESKLSTELFKQVKKEMDRI